MIRRPPRSTLSSSSAASDVYKRQVLYQVDNGVCLITLNAPQRMNTMSGHMNLGVQVALDMATEDPQVRVVCLTGTGRAFCAGGDLASGGASGGFKGSNKAKIPPSVAMAVRNLRAGMSSSESLRNMDKPTIAIVNGACAGAGFSWCCACDLRFASEKAVFKTAFRTSGLSGDFGGTWLLPRIIGSAKAREMYLLDKKVRAPEALAMGLCSEVFPAAELVPSVLKIAAEMAEAAPLALKRIKQNLNNADELLHFSAALDREADNHARTAFHPDAQEAGRAFVEKRPPRFGGLPAREPWAQSKM
eukprot:TRINITY_DN23995_c0_g1_i1.p1 TRINITY_DN23995_c0_g1~~TRINITY_DN23995_c0_g1_i1.p1  ORF type:complete len:303 (-),score=83.94 TRINITY_DN23995_c0_g1_i1:275-1183(-)